MFLQKKKPTSYKREKRMQFKQHALKQQCGAHEMNRIVEEN